MFVNGLSYSGYDTGVISGALVTIKGDLGPAVLSDGQKVRFLDGMRFVER